MIGAERRRWHDHAAQSSAMAMQKPHSPDERILWRQGWEAPRWPVLDHDEDVDVAIVGGGLTGLSLAHHLQPHTRVAVLDARQIAYGASGRSNGQVIPHHSGRSPAEVDAALGPGHGPRFNALVGSAAASLFELVHTLDIDCAASSRGWIQAAHSIGQLRRARRIFEEWRALGARVEWLDQDAVAARLGSSGYHGGWKALDGGTINPAQFVAGLARNFAERGGFIFEHSPARSITHEAKRWRVRAPRGTITAATVLIATSAYTDSLWPELARAFVPVRVYQVASAPLPPELRARILPGREGMSDTRHDLRYIRYAADHRLITGHSHIFWSDARRRGLREGRIIARIYPDLPAIPVEEYWEGLIAVTLDRFPRIVRLDQDVYFIGAYSGRGVALSVALGRSVADWLVGRLAENELPLPVTRLQPVPAHGLAKAAVGLAQQWARVHDRVA